MLERLARVVQSTSIDNEIHKSVEMHARFKKQLVLTKKRIQMQKLTDENHLMLKRIQEVPPVYNHLAWEEDARRQERIKRNMALYPEYYVKIEKEEEKKKELDREKSLRKSASVVRLPKI
jgi:hypothetical protein